MPPKTKAKPRKPEVDVATATRRSPRNTPPQTGHNSAPLPAATPEGIPPQSTTEVVNVDGTGRTTPVVRSKGHYLIGQTSALEHKTAIVVTKNDMEDFLPHVSYAKGLSDAAVDELFGPKRLETLIKRANTIKSSQGAEQVLYVPLAIMLNTLSLLHYEEASKTNTKLGKPIVWFVNPSHPLSGDTFGTRIQPDLVASVCEKDQLEEYLQRLAQFGPNYKMKNADVKEFAELRPSTLR